MPWSPPRRVWVGISTPTAELTSDIREQQKNGGDPCWESPPVVCASWPPVIRVLFTACGFPAERTRKFDWDAQSGAPSRRLVQSVATYPAKFPACAGGRPGAGALRLFGLAAGGVCLAADVTTRAVRSYRTISPLPALRRAVFFLLHFPSDSRCTKSASPPCR